MEISLLNVGDQIEKETWTKLQPYLSKYEAVWRMIVVPLRDPGSIYLSRGIDENLETFAMNNYTAYVNMARAIDKIETRSDDLKYGEEIWTNLQRAVEVATKGAAAFSRAYREHTRKDAGINTQQLIGAEESIKVYRNRLHDPIPVTLKDEQGVRLIPKRDKLEKYSLWTTVMYDHDRLDFIPVETQLRDDFYRVCSALQELWTQIEKRSGELLQSAGYQWMIAQKLKSALSNAYRPTTINVDSTSGSITASDSYWIEPGSKFPR